MHIHRLQVLGAALLFSTGGAAVKATILAPAQVACFRSGIAAVALMLVMPAWRRGWRGRTLLVGVAYAATMMLFVFANKLTTAANTIFLQATAPMYLLLFGPWLLRERIGRSDVIFTVVLAAGMLMFFVGTEPPFETAPDPLRGNILGACAGLTWALTILGLRWLGRTDGPGRDSAGAAVVAGNLMACLACLPLALPVTSSRPTDWLLVAYLGLFQIGLAYVWMTRGVRRVPALEASLLLLLEPVLSVFWAWLVHGERPGPWSLAGCSIILVATVARTLRSGA
jgi:drug/metabolite transporter (DMT)-like permease